MLKLKVKVTGKIKVKGKTIRGDECEWEVKYVKGVGKLEYEHESEYDNDDDGEPKIKMINWVTFLRKCYTEEPIREKNILKEDGDEKFYCHICRFSKNDRGIMYRHIGRGISDNFYKILTI